MRLLETIGTKSTLDPDDVAYLNKIIVVLRDRGEYTKAIYLDALVDNSSKNK